LKKYVIIVAGGSGKRMESVVAKQFICIDGVPILMRTVKAFFDYSKEMDIVVVLPASHIEQWNQLCREYKFTIPHKTAIGGETRFHSVKNGLESIAEDDCLIAVHDGVRPFVSKKIIDDVFLCAEKNGTAVPCIKLNDSIRLMENGNTRPFDREYIYVVQTPQCFHGRTIKKAYEQDYKDRFTDDATVVENTGCAINIVDGSRENLKITTPLDITIAEAFLKPGGK
jgi:2-C-methyl-D-erythritol 4-phosphate cytidylyltransferase